MKEKLDRNIGTKKVRLHWEYHKTMNIFGFLRLIYNSTILQLSIFPSFQASQYGHLPFISDLTVRTSSLHFRPHSTDIFPSFQASQYGHLPLISGLTVRVFGPYQTVGGGRRSRHQTTRPRKCLRSSLGGHQQSYRYRTVFHQPRSYHRPAGW